MSSNADLLGVTCDQPGCKGAAVVVLARHVDREERFDPGLNKTVKSRGMAYDATKHPRCVRHLAVPIPEVET